MTERKRERISEQIIREYGFEPAHATVILTLMSLFAGIRQRPLKTEEIREIEHDFETVLDEQTLREDVAHMDIFKEMVAESKERLGVLVDAGAEIKSQIELLRHIVEVDTKQRAPHAWITEDTFGLAYMALAEFALETLPQDVKAQLVGPIRNGEVLRSLAGSIGLCMQHISKIDFAKLEGGSANSNNVAGWPVSKPKAVNNVRKNKTHFSPRTKESSLPSIQQPLPS